MLIDTQLHLVDPVRFPFETTGAGYRPTDAETGDLDTLLSTLDTHGVGRGVLVQPSGYGTDNAAIFDALTRAGDRLRGIVMQKSVKAPAQAGVMGVRLNLTDYAHHDLRSAISMGSAVLRGGMILQVQARPSDLAALVRLLPAGPVILDHLGRPDPGRAEDIATISALAERSETWLKVSGGFRLGTAWRVPPASLLSLVAAWPPERIIWGSDWPFLNADDRPTYGEVMEWAAALTDLEAASANAARLFGWQDD